MYAAEKSEDCPVVARTPATQRWISDCLLASMSQSRLNSLAELSIEKETLNSIDSPALLTSLLA